MRKGRVWFWAVLGTVLLLSRLVHWNILWADEDYHLAAAIQLLHGKVLYRDIWYDKPPLSALFCTLFGAWPGLPLRIVGTILSLSACVLSFRFAAKLWSPREGYWAAGMLGFFLIFYVAPATLPLEPDTLMIVPHLAAVYLAWQRRPFASGIFAGLAFLLNTKGAFVLLSCLIFMPSGWLLLGAGFLLPNALMLGWLASQHALPDYITQVWRWGLLYAGSPPGSDPTESALIRARNWFGFHSALLIGLVYSWKKLDRRLLLWVAISFIATGIGLRFSPHYFNQLLPPLAICSACVGQAWSLRRDFQIPPRAVYGALAIALLVPAIRFGPRYFQLAAEDLSSTPHTWRDVSMDQESRSAAALVNNLAKPSDTLFIWGYRPNLVVYTRLPIASQFWDSQPITGVPADRHLGDAHAVDPEWARRNQQALAQTSPTFILDGLSLYNRQLHIHNFPELSSWLARYCEAGRTGGIIIYRLCATP